jgi:hypothetical protein
MDRIVANPPIPTRGSEHGITALLFLPLLFATALITWPAAVLSQTVPTGIGAWSIVGPFANTGGMGIQRLTHPEVSDDTTTTFENLWGGRARWNPYHATDLFGWVNLSGHTPEKSCLFLARTYINSLSRQRVHLRFGLIGSARLFLNDSLILAVDDDVFARSTSMTVSCMLARGWNKLQLRIGRDVMPLLSFSLSIEDTTGSPLPGLTVSTNPRPIIPSNPEARLAERRTQEIDTTFQRNDNILRALRMAADQDTSGVAWMCRRAQESLDANDATGADSYATRALDIVQEHAPAWHLRGLAFHQRGVADSARLCIDQALVIDPGMPDAWHTALNILKRPNPLDEIGRVDLDSTANSAAREPVSDSLSLETIFADVQQAVLSGSTVLKRVRNVIRIHRIDSTAPLPMPARFPLGTLGRQELVIVSRGGSQRTIDMLDSTASLSDASAGDVLIYTADRIVRDSAFPLYASAGMGFSVASPVRRARLSVIVPSTAYYQFYAQNFTPDFSDREVSGGTLFTWETRNVPAMVPEPFMPPEQHFAPRIEFGTYPNWLVINTYVEDCYARRRQACDELRAVVDRLLPPGVKWPKEIVAQTISRFVIDSISLSSDGASLTAPRRACDVLQLRSGSAADKVVLAATMMAERGVEAVPALVNTEASITYREPVPSFPFDHVILVLPGDTRAHMIDLTARTQPFGMVPRTIEDRFAAPIGERMRDPVRLHKRYINRREFHTTSRLVFSDARMANGEFTIRSADFDSTSALMMRRMFTSSAAADLSPAYDSAWITPTKKNPETPTIHMRGRVQGTADSSADTIMVRPQWMNLPCYQMAPYDLEQRTYPLDLAAEYDSVTAEIVIVPPPGYAFVKPPAAVSIKLPSISYSYSATIKGKSLRLQRSIVVHKGLVEPADYPEFRKAHLTMLSSDLAPVILVRQGAGSRR